MFLDWLGNGPGRSTLNRWNDVSVAIMRPEQETDEIDFPEFESFLSAVGVGHRRRCSARNGPAQLARDA